MLSLAQFINSYNFGEGGILFILEVWMYFDHYGVLSGIGHFRGFGDILVILEVWRYFSHFEGFRGVCWSF